MKRNLIENPYTFWERLFSSPKDELGKPLKFRKNKIMKSPMYRLIPKKDWEDTLGTGKFKTSFPLEQREGHLERLKETDPHLYKKVIYGQNSRKFTRVTPKKKDALMHSNSESDVLVELKPIYKKLFPSTEYGGYNEIFAYDLSIKDLSTVTNKKGEIIYHEPSYQGPSKVTPLVNPLERKLISEIFLLLFLVGISLIPANLTANIIGNYGTVHRLIGITLILLAISGYFVYNKLRG